MLKYCRRCYKQLVIRSVVFLSAQASLTKEDERHDAVDTNAIEDRYDEVGDSEDLHTFSVRQLTVIVSTYTCGL
jgi:hypothetical protein